MNSPVIIVYLGNSNSQHVLTTFHQNKFYPMMSIQPHVHDTNLKNAIYVMEKGDCVVLSTHEYYDLGKVTAVVYWNVDADLATATLYFHDLLDGYITYSKEWHIMKSLGFFDPAPVQKPITSWEDWVDKDYFKSWEPEVHEKRERPGSPPPPATKSIKL